MSYAVRLHPQVDRFLRSCEKGLGRRIRRKLRMVAEEPHIYLERLSGQDFYKLRVGDYRALIDVDEGRKTVFVRYIDHRKRVYQRHP